LLAEGSNYQCRALNLRDEDNAGVGQLTEVNGPLIVLVPFAQEGTFVDCTIDVFGKEPAKIGEWYK
jgi:hypothetical protein